MDCAGRPDEAADALRFRPPGWDFAFGTDNFGRSLWSRVIWGARLSLVIGFSVVALNAVFGTLIGALAGYFRRLDNALMRVMDALMAFPAILLAIAIAAALGPVRAQRHSRAGGRLHPAHRAHRALLRARGARDGIRAGGASRPARGTGASCAATSCPTPWRRCSCS